MKQKLENARYEYLMRVRDSMTFDDRREFTMMVAKKQVDYAFSKEFEKHVAAELFQEMHPALKDLHNQYKEMETLIKKEDTK